MKLTKEELKLRNKIYYEKNKEKIKVKSKAWKEANKEKAKESCKKSMQKKRLHSPKEIEKGRMLKYKYNISWDDFVFLFNQQNGSCAICKIPLKLISEGLKHTTANVDHCHTTNRVRGLLCNQCNQALGLFKDNATLLRLAAEYLDASN